MTATLAPGLAVRTDPDLVPATEKPIDRSYAPFIAARMPDTPGVLLRTLPGYDDPVWVVTHPSGAQAAYAVDELTVIETTATEGAQR